MFRSYMRELGDLNNISDSTNRGLVIGGVLGALAPLVLNYSASGSSFKQYVNQLLNSSDDPDPLYFTTFLSLIVGGFLGGALGHYIHSHLRRPRG